MSKAKSTSARNSQARGLKTRDRILTAAVRCLVKEGVHALRYAHVAKQAKVPQALMGYHFPTVDSLLLALIGVEIEKLKVASVENVQRFATQPKRALAAYIRTPFEIAESDQEFRAVWTAFYHLCTIQSTFAELNATVRLLGRERILNLVTMVLATEGRLAGEDTIRREDLMQLAISIQIVITGAILMTVTDSTSNYRAMAEFAVKNSYRILDV